MILPRKVPRRLAAPSRVAAQQAVAAQFDATLVDAAKGLRCYGIFKR